MPIPPYLRRRYTIELNKIIMLTRLVTAEFPQPPFYRIVID